ncbi:MAG TPA: hypothetical protein VHS74_20665, partial [Solirubrobacterales bacterium]|nr:hypothetical protein [Solirubrobacterales bacterium]
MEARDASGHLRPVPDPGRTFPEIGPAEPSVEPLAPVEAVATPGLTHPRSRGRSGAFVTDVLVDLGHVGDERARQAIEEARTAGKPPERLLLEQGAITSDQLSRAIAERYGLD